MIITCTKKEKERFLSGRSIASCPPAMSELKGTEDTCNIGCAECWEKNIKWNIVPEPVWNHVCDDGSCCYVCSNCKRKNIVPTKVCPECKFEMRCE